MAHISIHRGFTVPHPQRFHVDSLSQVALPCSCCSGLLGLMIPSLYDCFPFSIWASQCILSPRLLPDHFAGLLYFLWLKTVITFPLQRLCFTFIWEHKIYRSNIMIILFLEIYPSGYIWENVEWVSKSDRLNSIFWNPYDGRRKITATNWPLISTLILRHLPIHIDTCVEFINIIMHMHNHTKSKNINLIKVYAKYDAHFWNFI